MTHNEKQSFVRLNISTIINAILTQRLAQASFAALSEGVRAGLSQLVGDNHEQVAKMLDKKSVSHVSMSAARSVSISVFRHGMIIIRVCMIVQDASAISLAEACAGVMAQQQV